MYRRLLHLSPSFRPPTASATHAPSWCVCRNPYHAFHTAAHRSTRTAVCFKLCMVYLPTLFNCLLRWCEEKSSPYRCRRWYVVRILWKLIKWVVLHIDCWVSWRIAELWSRQFWPFLKCSSSYNCVGDSRCESRRLWWKGAVTFSGSDIIATVSPSVSTQISASHSGSIYYSTSLAILKGLNVKIIVMMFLIRNVNSCLAVRIAVAFTFWNV